MKFYKRNLSYRQAGRCEAALGKVCRCRCRGKLHGINHKLFVEKQQELFNYNDIVDEETIDEILDEVLA